MPRSHAPRHACTASTCACPHTQVLGRNKVGRGKYGDVYEGVDSHTNASCIVKILKVRGWGGGGGGKRRGGLAWPCVCSSCWDGAWPGLDWTGS